MALNVRTKEDTIKVCDEEIRKVLDSLHAESGDADTVWHWDTIDRWLDIRICLMRKVGKI